MTCADLHAPIESIVSQHVGEAASLRRLRSRRVRAPGLRLADLARFDERLAAHLDGVRVAGSVGRLLAGQALERAGPGEVFVAAVGALDDRDDAAVDRLVAVAEALPAARAGFVSALGWVSAAGLRGRVAGWLAPGAGPLQRRLGLLACALHAVDPGRALDAALRDPDGALRRAALGAAARLGRRERLDGVRAALVDAAADVDTRFAAARAALLLGDRGAGLDAVVAIASDAADPHHDAALSLALKLVSPAQAQRLLAPLGRDRPRALVGHLASAGDPRTVPWLLERLAQPALARRAALAIAWITGLDLAARRFVGRPPEARQHAGDDAVDADEDGDDDTLPWPDAAKIRAWWRDDGPRFVPGVRHFGGEPLAAAVCRRILSTGGQTQRRAAAEHLVLLAPGAALFDTAAPAWRQRRRLAAGT